jgi:hypothetical protein
MHVLNSGLYRHPNGSYNSSCSGSSDPAPAVGGGLTVSVRCEVGCGDELPSQPRLLSRSHGASHESQSTTLIGNAL